VFSLGVVSFSLAFPLRNYRVNSHLQVAHEQKRNAPNTYLDFVEATTPSAHDIVTTELVRFVFSEAQVGYLDTIGDKTIIDSSAGMVGLQLSQGRNVAT
jgi:hypothetical protein